MRNPPGCPGTRRRKVTQSRSGRRFNERRRPGQSKASDKRHPGDWGPEGVDHLPKTSFSRIGTLRGGHRRVLKRRSRQQPRRGSRDAEGWRETKKALRKDIRRRREGGGKGEGDGTVRCTRLRLMLRKEDDTSDWPFFDPAQCTKPARVCPGGVSPTGRNNRAPGGQGKFLHTFW